MPDRALPRDGFAGAARRALFAACVACTLWLVVENSILIALIAHGHAAEFLRSALVHVHAGGAGR